ncbi:hypothetical protein [Scleromatobacter humisilvae]|uniref:Uncharacterized protein n=1 Tax=Scleromatobacter humisilvae TaxID=2897159 RepID=A0A9X1YMU7_9BURK|nr:hypothetical protein [Scleromatobacter humisilvae]MCK9688901.1 hypothetical protein [Scleromatobacter humisilvae]
MAILSSTISAWEPFEASLLEWRRLCKRMECLDSSQGIDAESDRTHLGEVLWGIEVKDSGSTPRMLGVCWEWREVIPNVVALSNPLGIQSNVRLKDETGALVTPAKLILHLNAAVSGFRWQGRLVRDAGVHRDMAA